MMTKQDEFLKNAFNLWVSNKITNSKYEFLLENKDSLAPLEKTEKISKVYIVETAKDENKVKVMISKNWADPVQVAEVNSDFTTGINNLDERIASALNLSTENEQSRKYWVKYWATKMHRDQGLSDYYNSYATFDDAKDALNDLISDKYGVSAELIINVNDEEVTLFGYYPERHLR